MFISDANMRHQTKEGKRPVARPKLHNLLWHTESETTFVRYNESPFVNLMDHVLFDELSMLSTASAVAIDKFEDTPDGRFVM